MTEKKLLRDLKGGFAGALARQVLEREMKTLWLLLVETARALSAFAAFG